MVGGASSGVVTLECNGFNSNLHQIQSFLITNVALSGPGVAAYSETQTLNGMAFTVNGQQSNEILKFSPGGASTFNATITFTYSTLDGFGHVLASGLILGASLTGTGITGGATGEAPGLVQSFRRELIPINGSVGSLLAYFDSTTFNDPIDGSTYIYRAEDIVMSRVPTVRRVTLTYLDLGVATLAITITGANDLGALVTNTVTITIGNTIPTGLLLTAFADIVITCFRPQLSIFRAASGGPVQITAALISGTVETETTL